MDSPGWGKCRYSRKPITVSSKGPPVFPGERRAATGIREHPFCRARQCQDRPYLRLGVLGMLLSSSSRDGGVTGRSDLFRIDMDDSTRDGAGIATTNIPEI